MKILRALVITFAIGSPAYGQGVTIVMRDTINGQAATHQMQIAPTHVRVDTHTNNENAAFIYDGPAKMIRMINFSQKSYTEMSQAQMQQLGQQASAAMAGIQEQMKNMTPEQRKMMEDMMKGRGMPGMGAPPARPQFKSAGTDRVGQWACTRHEGYRGAEKVAEVCAVEPTALGLTPADFEGVKQLADFLKSMMPQAADQITVNATAAEHGYSGVPVRRINFTNGKPQSTTEITEVKRGAIPASAFVVPEGFRRESMPGMR